MTKSVIVESDDPDLYTRRDEDDMETQPDPETCQSDHNPDGHPLESQQDEETQPDQPDDTELPPDNEINAHDEMEIEDAAALPDTESGPLIEGIESPTTLAPEPDQLPLTPLPINPSLDRNNQAPSTNATKRSGLNGFRLFAKQYRLDHPDECKQPVSAVSKIIGAAWKALTNDIRAEWNTTAANQFQAVSGTDKPSSKAGTDGEVLGSRLQMSRVKGIMQLDPDVHHISKEAVELVRAGAELFIGFMCKTGIRYCGSRHSIQYPDFRQMIKTEPKLKFLLGAFNSNNTDAAQNRPRIGSLKRSRASTSGSAASPPSKSSKITSFFQKAPAA